MIALILVFLAAIFNAVMDKISFHFSTSVFNNLSDWWNPKESWKFKWKNGNKEEGEKFFLSSTLLVWVTDAWHLFKIIMNVFLMLAIVLYHPILNNFILDFALLKVIHSGTFHVFFTYVFERREQEINKL